MEKEHKKIDFKQYIAVFFFLSLGAFLVGLLGNILESWKFRLLEE